MFGNQPPPSTIFSNKPRSNFTLFPNSTFATQPTTSLFSTNTPGQYKTGISPNSNPAFSTGNRFGGVDNQSSPFTSNANTPFSGFGGFTNSSGGFNQGNSPQNSIGGFNANFFNSTQSSTPQSLYNKPSNPNFSFNQGTSSGFGMGTTQSTFKPYSIPPNLYFNIAASKQDCSQDELRWQHYKSQSNKNINNRIGTPSSVFGGSTMGSTGGGLFGGPSSIFGSSSTTFSSSPVFGQNSSSNFMSSPVNTLSSPFGMSSQPQFGLTTTQFGSPSPQFGTSTTSPFGASNPMFGSASSSPFGSSSTPFGSPAPQFGSSGSQFLSPSFGSSSSLFNSSSPAFGSSTSIFGPTNPSITNPMLANQPSLFSTSQSPFMSNAPLNSGPQNPLGGISNTTNTSPFFISSTSGTAPSGNLFSSPSMFGNTLSQQSQSTFSSISPFSQPIGSTFSSAPLFSTNLSNTNPQGTASTSNLFSSPFSTSSSSLFSSPLTSSSSSPFSSQSQLFPQTLSINPQQTPTSISLFNQPQSNSLFSQQPQTINPLFSQTSPLFSQSNPLLSFQTQPFRGTQSNLFMPTNNPLSSSLFGTPTNTSPLFSTTGNSSNLLLNTSNSNNYNDLLLNKLAHPTLTNTSQTLNSSASLLSPSIYLELAQNPSLPSLISTQTLNSLISSPPNIYGLSQLTRKGELTLSTSRPHPSILDVPFRHSNIQSLVSPSSYLWKHSPHRPSQQPSSPLSSFLPELKHSSYTSNYPTTYYDIFSLSETAIHNIIQLPQNRDWLHPSIHTRTHNSSPLLRFKSLFYDKPNTPDPSHKISSPVIGKSIISSPLSSNIDQNQTQITPSPLFQPQDHMQLPTILLTQPNQSTTTHTHQSQHFLPPNQSNPHTWETTHDNTANHLLTSSHCTEDQANMIDRQPETSHDYVTNFDDTRRRASQSISSLICPKLTKEGYSCFPSLHTLNKMSEAELSHVFDFTVKRDGYGEITWPGYTDLRLLNIDKIVNIDHLKISVYDNFDEAPPVGKGLNKRAQILLKNCSPSLSNKHNSLSNNTTTPHTHAQTILNQISTLKHKQSAHLLHTDPPQSPSQTYTGDPHTDHSQDTDQLSHIQQPSHVYSSRSDVDSQTIISQDDPHKTHITGGNTELLTPTTHQSSSHKSEDDEEHYDDDTTIQSHSGTELRKTHTSSDTHPHLTQFFVKKLQKYTQKMGAKFISLDTQNWDWHFEVPHF